MRVLGVTNPHCSIRPCAARAINSRMRRRTPQGIQRFSTRASTRAVGTPPNMRGMNNTGERATMVVEAVTEQTSAAMSQAELPTPTTSTSLPRKRSGVR